MCRQYNFRFLECGHIYSNPCWRFRWAHHPPGCVMEEVIFERNQHCFGCLQKESMPVSRRNIPHRRIDFSLAADRLSRIIIHHREHPDGPQHFDVDDLAALSLEHPELSEAHRLYVEEYEEDCDNWLWAMKDAVEHFSDLHSEETVIQRFRCQRNFVLQMRFAHLTALVHEVERAYMYHEKVEDAIEDFHMRVNERIYAILTEMEDKDLTEDDNCPICYSMLKQSKAADFNDPVKTRCGHLFCEDCIFKWLETSTGTCPSCRANFHLERADADDWEITCNRILEGLLNPPEPPTPWWVTMLKDE